MVLSCPVCMVSSSEWFLSKGAQTAGQLCITSGGGGKYFSWPATMISPLAGRKVFDGRGGGCVRLQMDAWGNVGLSGRGWENENGVKDPWRNMLQSASQIFPAVWFEAFWDLKHSFAFTEHLVLFRFESGGGEAHEDCMLRMGRENS